MSGALTFCALVVAVAPSRQENVTSVGKQRLPALLFGLRLHLGCCAALAHGR